MTYKETSSLAISGFTIADSGYQSALQTWGLIMSHVFTDPHLCNLAPSLWIAPNGAESEEE